MFGEVQTAGVGGPDLSLILFFSFRREKARVLPSAYMHATKLCESTTLSGGSLGSCVDEERSQLRELM